MLMHRNGPLGKRSWTSLLRLTPTTSAGAPRPIEKTEPSPGLRPVEPDKTVATPVPAHVIAAAATAADLAEVPRQRRRLQLLKLLVTAYRTVGFAILTLIV